LSPRGTDGEPGVESLPQNTLDEPAAALASPIEYADAPLGLTLDPVPLDASLPVPPIGGITLVVAPSYLPALAEFLDATAAGHRGVGVVRESPERLRARVGPRPVEIFWLTNLGRGLTLRPNDLAGYGAFLHHAVEQDRVTAFFLEGIEYLARLHGTEQVVERLATFHAEARARGARAWVYIHPDLISPADLARFQKAFGGGRAAG
jgi:hypothetical protein